MVFKNVDAFAAFNVMKGLHETGKLGYAIAKNMRKISAELKEYVDTIDGIAKRMGREVEPGKYKVDDMIAYAEERKQYDNIECNIDVMQVDEDVFTGGTLTSDQMYVLDWMVK